MGGGGGGIKRVGVSITADLSRTCMEMARVRNCIRFSEKT